jgi:hypothetical protein
MSTAIAINRQLLDAAEKLVLDHPDHTAGSVLRCYARAVRQAVQRGVGATGLPAVSVETARRMLENRQPDSGSVTRLR